MHANAGLQAIAIARIALAAKAPCTTRALFTTRWDILHFSVDAKHVSPEFPEGYWPKTPAPPSGQAWDKSVRQFFADLNSMCKLVRDPRRDLLVRIPHGTGQTLLREALLVADHNSYHLGQIVTLRKMLERR